MKIRNMLLVLMPVLLFACTALKPVEKLTDNELADRYDQIDLQIYMVKHAASKDTPAKYPGVSGSSGSGYSNRDIEKIKKLEEKLRVVRQELIKRGYMP
ncbi:MAG: hypothetical protein ACE5D6_07910 [Candidatus Zixiibacteriota bacterium]